MRRRLDVLDYTGIRRQLVFPGNLALHAAFLHGFADEPGFFPGIGGDRRNVALQMLDAHNSWVVRQARISDRLRPVASLVAGSPDDLKAKAKRLIDSGVRTLWLPSSILPGGRSPAHNDLDPFWSLCAASNTVVTLHIGNEPGFFRTLGWKQARAFEGWKVGNEISADPWTLSTGHMATENFLMTMVTGAVFERHPELRLGVIELGADWIGPTAYRLDMWYRNSQFKTWNKLLSMPPSEFIRRNVRVSAYPFEKIDEYIRMYGLTEVYCYSSDYPHVEGGKDPMEFWAGRLAPLGADVMEKFFVRNGTWLMPD